MVKRYLAGIMIFCLVFSGAEIYFFKAFTYLLQRDVRIQCMPVGRGKISQHLYTILQTEPELSFNLLHKDVAVEFSGIQEQFTMDSLVNKGITVYSLSGDLYFSNQKNIYILKRAAFHH
jgi:hypothetical protein